MNRRRALIVAAVVLTLAGCARQDRGMGGYTEQEIVQILREHPEMKGPGDVQAWIIRHPKAAP